MRLRTQIGHLVVRTGVHIQELISATTTTTAAAATAETTTSKTSSISSSSNSSTTKVGSDSDAKAVDFTVGDRNAGTGTKRRTIDFESESPSAFSFHSIRTVRRVNGADHRHRPRIRGRDKGRDRVSKWPTVEEQVEPTYPTANWSDDSGSLTSTINLILDDGDNDPKGLDIMEDSDSGSDVLNIENGPTIADEIKHCSTHSLRGHRSTSEIGYQENDKDRGIRGEYLVAGIPFSTAVLFGYHPYSRDLPDLTLSCSSSATHSLECSILGCSSSSWILPTLCSSLSNISVIETEPESESESVGTYPAAAAGATVSRISTSPTLTTTSSTSSTTSTISTTSTTPTTATSTKSTSKHRGRIPQHTLLPHLFTIFTHQLYQLDGCFLWTPGHEAALGCEPATVPDELLEGISLDGSEFWNKSRSSAGEIINNLDQTWQTIRDGMTGSVRIGRYEGVGIRQEECSWLYSFRDLVRRWEGARNEDGLTSKDPNWTPSLTREEEIVANSPIKATGHASVVVAIGEQGRTRKGRKRKKKKKKRKKKGDDERGSKHEEGVGKKSIESDQANRKSRSFRSSTTSLIRIGEKWAPWFFFPRSRAADKPVRRKTAELGRAVDLVYDLTRHLVAQLQLYCNAYYWRKERWYALLRKSQIELRDRLRERRRTVMIARE